MTSKVDASNGKSLGSAYQVARMVAARAGGRSHARRAAIFGRLARGCEPEEVAGRIHRELVGAIL